MQGIIAGGLVAESLRGAAGKATAGAASTAGDAVRAAGGAVDSATRFLRDDPDAVPETPGLRHAALGSAGEAGSRPPSAAAVAPASAASRLSNQELVDRGKARLRESPAGAQVLAELEASNARIIPLDDARYEQLTSWYAEGSGGLYVPGLHAMLIPRSSLLDEDRAALIIAHEGVHYLDFERENDGLIAARVIAAGARGLAADGVQLGPGVIERSFNSFYAGANDELLKTEVNAYRTQAQIARELGASDNGYGTAPGGRLRSDEEILERLRSDPMYNRRA